MDTVCMKGTAGYLLEMQGAYCLPYQYGAWFCRKQNVTELVSLGGFKNVRSDFDFEGVKLELDETQFDWGTVYEIEVETVSVPTFSYSLPCAKIMEDSSLVITGFS